MIIWPECSITTLRDCASGSIVRPIGIIASGGFAIACDSDRDGHRALIFFERDGPVYQVISRPEEVNLLEYEGESSLLIDNAGPFEPRPKKMYEATGCVLRNKDGWRLNVGRLPEQGIARKQYDLTNRVLVEFNEDTRGGAFGKWRLVLQNPTRKDHPQVEINAFEWKEPSGDKN